MFHFPSPTMVCARCPWTQSQKCPLDPNFWQLFPSQIPHLPGWHHWVTAHPAGASLLLWSEGDLGPFYYRDNAGIPHSLPAALQQNRKWYWLHYRSTDPLCHTPPSQGSSSWLSHLWLSDSPPSHPTLRYQGNRLTWLGDNKWQLFSWGGWGPEILD